MNEIKNAEKKKEQEKNKVQPARKSLLENPKSTERPKINKKDQPPKPKMLNPNKDKEDYP